MKSDSAKLGIVILNWCNFDDTRQCIESLLACDAGGWTMRILLVDNGSGDDSLARLRAVFANRIDYLALPHNTGFAGGNNNGIRALLQRGFDYVLLLNNDTTVAPDFLLALFRGVSRYPASSIFAARIYYQQPSDVLWYAGGAFQAWLARIIHYGFRSPDGEQFARDADVTFVTGCAMLIHHQVFARIGLLDDALFLYFEDVDFCQRARAAGVGMKYLAAARLWHKIGAHGSEHRRRHDLTPRYLYYQTRNRYIVMQRGRGYLYRIWLALLHVGLYTGVRLGTILFSPSPSRWQQIGAVCRGCMDGLLNRTLIPESRQL